MLTKRVDRHWLYAWQWCIVALALGGAAVAYAQFGGRVAVPGQNAGNGQTPEQRLYPAGLPKMESMLKSALADASRFPSALTATLTTQLECPGNVCNTSPLVASHTSTTPGWPNMPLAEASRFPSGLNATLQTVWDQWVCPFNVCNSAPLVASHVDGGVLSAQSSPLCLTRVVSQILQGCANPQFTGSRREKAL